MDQGNLAGIISELTDRALWEVKNVMDCIPDELWDREYCGMPIWKHVYHMLHSFDQWYINPDCYMEPDFHTANLNNLDVLTGDKLSRDVLNRYYETISTKIKEYDGSLADASLLEQPDNCIWTRFTLILAQYRHLHSHMGMIMGFIIADTGKWPRVVGLTHDIPTGEYDKYF